MSALQSIMAQYQKMSRPMQWASLAAVGLVLFLLWDRVVTPYTNDLNDAGDRIANNVRELRSIETDAAKLKNTRSNVVWTIGPVRPPAPVAEGARMFDQIVNEVMQKHGATNFTLSSRPRGKLPRSALVGFTRGGTRIDRLTADIKFDASPENAVAIIAELESSPHIESITTLRLVRDTGRKVRVNLSVEWWVIAAASSEGGVI